jgi:hypothetical protein
MKRGFRRWQLVDSDQHGDHKYRAPDASAE